MALIEIDGFPSYKMGGFSMANCECHNQRVRVSNFQTLCVLIYLDDPEQTFNNLKN